MIRNLMLLAVFALGAVFMAYHPEYIDYVKEKWEDTKEASIDFKDDLKDGAQDLGKLKDSK